MAPIGTCCFYIAARTHEAPSSLPDATELLKLSRCGGTLADLHNTERLICEALNGCTTDVTALTLLQFFYELFALQDGSDTSLNSHVLASLVAKLEVLTCQFEFTRFRVSILSNIVFCEQT